MSTSLDIRAAYLAGTPILFWKNRGDLFVIGSQTVAHDGTLATQRLVKNDLIGAPMLVKYIIAKAATIKNWQNKLKDNAFATTTLTSSFSTGHTVIFQQVPDAITYQNTLLKDGSYDLDQNIFAAGANYRRGFDVWEGTLKLIIMS